MEFSTRSFRQVLAESKAFTSESETSNTVLEKFLDEHFPPEV